MFTVEEILEKADEYQRSRISLAEFDSWFEDNWDDAVNVDSLLASARAAVDGAIAQYYFDHIGEQAFRWELAVATRPFARLARVSAPTISLVYGKPLVVATTATRELPIYWERAIA